MQVKELVKLLENMTEGHTENKEIKYKFGKTMTDEMKTLLYKNDFLINDHYYDYLDDWTSDIIDRLNIDDEEEFNSIEDIEGILDELSCEIESDIYTHDLTTWLNSSISHVEYLDNATGDTGFWKLSNAQYEWKYEFFHVFNGLIELIMENN